MRANNNNKTPTHALVRVRRTDTGNIKPYSAMFRLNPGGELPVEGDTGYAQYRKALAKMGHILERIGDGHEIVVDKIAL